MGRSERRRSEASVSARKKEPPWYQVSAERLIASMVLALESFSALANEAREYVSILNRRQRNASPPTDADEAAHLTKVAVEAAEVGADLEQLADKLTTEPVAPADTNT